MMALSRGVPAVTWSLDVLSTGNITATSTAPRIDLGELTTHAHASAETKASVAGMLLKWRRSKGSLTHWDRALRRWPPLPSGLGVIKLHHGRRPKRNRFIPTGTTSHHDWRTDRRALIGRRGSSSRKRGRGPCVIAAVPAVVANLNVTRRIRTSHAEGTCRPRLKDLGVMAWHTKRHTRGKPHAGASNSTTKRIAPGRKGKRGGNVEPTVFGGTGCQGTLLLSIRRRIGCSRTVTISSIIAFVVVVTALPLVRGLNFTPGRFEVGKGCWAR
mmetsp:Transcript_5041/g.11003  ORF Transcript_5041/g.11003 Transcript_5041/m.11003 type:complete len:271 (-) Transcript_5041:876-1688(-)